MNKTLFFVLATTIFVLVTIVTTSMGKALADNSPHETPNEQTNADENYVYYDDLGFAIQKNYVLEKKTLYLDMVDNFPHDGFKFLGAFVCAQNLEKDEPTLINIININVMEIVSNVAGAVIIDNYEASLKKSGIRVSRKALKGLTGVEYTFEQDLGGVSLPTIAFYGYSEERLFLIQMASMSDCKKKYDALLNSIKILNQVT